MVKKIILFSFLFIWAKAAFLQNVLREGKILYDISYQNLPAEMRRNEHMLPHDASFYFKGEKTRMEMGISGMGKNTTIYNGDSATNTVLLNIKGKKFALIKSDSEMVEVRQSFAPNDSNYAFLGVTVVNEFKKIVDFNCQKAIVKRKVNGIIQETICWFTKEIPPYNTKNDPNLHDIPGFLMQYSMTENGMSMTMTVKLVMRVPIEDSYFEIPQGYQIVSEKELNRILMVMQNGQ
ncbi:MAG: DUF4412 domain-containing protein [Bacteroidota bacterium]|nr:DUF4412 domain-containing protein [Bacteroidota bacterium]